ncbi:hypothetical protein TNCV_3258771 [Trichonephila clavipes]|nr:hypothetical protein TNCV_3258771 [Trichonephila clavipes]
MPSLGNQSLAPTDLGRVDEEMASPGRGIQISNRILIIPAILPDNSGRPYFSHTPAGSYLNSLGEQKLRQWRNLKQISEFVATLSDNSSRTYFKHTLANAYLMALERENLAYFETGHLNLKSEIVSTLPYFRHTLAEASLKSHGARKRHLAYFVTSNLNLISDVRNFFRKSQIILDDCLLRGP